MKIMDEKEFEKVNLFGKGNLNTAFAEFFDGTSWLNPLTAPDASAHPANVTFEPGCRNHWHIHHATQGGGQLLFCIAGEGWYQEEGKPAQALHPGDTVVIPANVKHWHGAAKDSWFSHVAMDIPGKDTSNEWCEAVDESDYLSL